MMKKYLFLFSIIFLIGSVSASELDISDTIWNNTEMDLSVSFEGTQAFADEVLQDTAISLYFANLSQSDGGESFTFNITETGTAVNGPPVWFYSSNSTYKEIGNNLTGSIDAITIIDYHSSYGTNCNNVSNIVYTAAGNSPITYNGTEAQGICNNLTGSGHEFAYNPSQSGNIIEIILTSAAKLGSEVNLLINGLSNDRTLGNNTEINITGYLITGEGTIQLYMNTTLWNEGESPLENITMLSEGTYPFNLTYLGNENYSASSEYLTLTIVNVSTNVTGGINRCRVTYLVYWNPRIPFLTEDDCSLYEMNYWNPKTNFLTEYGNGI